MNWKKELKCFSFTLRYTNISVVWMLFLDEIHLLHYAAVDLRATSTLSTEVATLNMQD